MLPLMLIIIAIAIAIDLIIFSRFIMCPFFDLVIIKKDTFPKLKDIQFNRDFETQL